MKRNALFAMALALATSLSALAQEEGMMPSGEQSVAASFGDDCCVECCCSGGFYGDFQYLRLNGYDTDGYFEDYVGSDDGYRVTLGYECCDGLGVRVRYFDYDGVQQDSVNDYNYGMKASYFDVEVTQSFCLCNLNGLVSGGYRHADYRLWYDDSLDADFEGDGITLGLELQRDITCHLGLFAWTQHSILFGDDEEQYDDYVIGWTEAQLGAQYATCVGGYNAVVRGGVEAQFHDGVASGYETSLFGWFLSAGVTY